MESDRESRFCEQTEEFVDTLLSDLGVSRLDSLGSVLTSPPRPLDPVLVESLDQLGETEIGTLRDAYLSEYGVAYLVLAQAPKRRGSNHVLFGIAEHLAKDFKLSHPLPHPLEEHPDVNQRFGGGDGTVKVFDFRKTEGGYVEQGETSRRFEMHHDGLGSAGTVQTVVLYADSAPMSGGFTYFQNMCRLGLELAKSDSAAFRSLFLPDALTVTRPRGKGALRVQTPVLYLNELRSPQSGYRRSSGEYDVRWRDRPQALLRAAEFLDRHTRPFSYASSFLHFTTRGHVCLIRNEQVAHGRTAFRDHDATGRVRVLSRKWFMRSSTDAVYKHVPGTRVASDYALLYPELFGNEVLNGEWLLADSGCENVRRSDRGDP